MASLGHTLGPAMALKLLRDGTNLQTRSFSSFSRIPSSLSYTERVRSSSSSGGSSSSRGITCAAGSYGEATSSLTHICHRIEFCFFEVCVQNLGRPAGLALHGFVSAAIEAFSCGYTREQVSLQLVFGSAAMQEFEVGMVGNRLTSIEEHYRSKWVDTVYTTLRILNEEADDASSLSVSTDMHLYRTIKHVIEGQKSGDEQSLINFDRGLATRGASGGIVARKVEIVPQLVPISQLVLLTLKVVNEQRSH
ncbi:hypothetical protein GOP47_0008992 [Adiantum capillus-veneris]|uniref:Uncharacterized protein n=1 Tax=Adiantum capillus-veneris TaxID=13818 RepID=A0A9D4UYL2_ADICA|nr:hypothetical protein GOP47_0008384 [Adiantum capillus-veneris]KAI5076927.1 hypothetical protein GOP47_0008992 [Adiantum capillus-veneris]